MRLALSLGEPAGIGPDLILQLLAEDACPADAECVVIADRQLLIGRAKLLGVSCQLNDFNPDNSQPGFSVLHISGGHSAKPGAPNPSTAGYVLECLKCATTGCQSSFFNGLVTGPVQKETINAAGYTFTGHTEFLADLTNTATVVMLLVAGSLRVALQTTHLPLRHVPEAINATDLAIKLKIIAAEVGRLFTQGKPKIGVAGLNPHAGEGGYLGTEEIDTIAPVINQLAAEGMLVSGPFPADTLFTPKYLRLFDVMLAMYHDQGLPVLKYAGFGEAVNVTLGLPLVRTSVDHGTALDLVGTGKADAGSIKAALYLAADMVRRQHA